MRVPDGSGHVTAEDTWSRFYCTHSLLNQVSKSFENSFGLRCLKRQRKVDREDGGIRQLRVSAGKDDDGTGSAPPVRACAKVGPPARVGWTARAALFERLILLCETARYRRSVGRRLTKTQTIIFAT